jgi:hypothetical protein
MERQKSFPGENCKKRAGSLGPVRSLLLYLFFRPEDQAAGSMHKGVFAEIYAYSDREKLNR